MSLRGSGGEYLLPRRATGGAYVAPGVGRWLSSFASCHRRSLRRSGGREVVISFPVTLPLASVGVSFTFGTLKVT